MEEIQWTNQDIEAAANDRPPWYIVTYAKGIPIFQIRRKVYAETTNQFHEYFFSRVYEGLPLYTKALAYIMQEKLKRKDFKFLEKTTVYRHYAITQAKKGDPLCQEIVTQMIAQKLNG